MEQYAHTKLYTVTIPAEEIADLLKMVTDTPGGLHRFELWYLVGTNEYIVDFKVMVDGTAQED